MHGVQGKNASQLYDRYYRRKTGINLNSANSVNNETNITEFTNAFQTELTLAPQDGGFDDTFIDKNLDNSIPYSPTVFGQLQIDSINLNQYVVSGTNEKNLEFIRTRDLIGL